MADLETWQASNCVEHVVKAIRACEPYQFTDEVALQVELFEALSQHFAALGRRVHREYTTMLGRSRVDFYVAGVAIEVKVKGSPAEVLRQLVRYAECEDVLHVVLVTTRYTHRAIVPPEGVPITIIHLQGGAL